MNVRGLFISAILFTVFLSLTATAQLSPGIIVVGASNGQLWTVDLKGTATTFVKLPGSVYGIDVDYNGDLICGGSAILWKVTPTGSISTILQGAPLTSLQGDAEVNQNGNVLVTSMGSSSVWEMTHKGVVVTTYTLTGSTRSWGLGIDRRDSMIYVAGLTTIHQIDPGTGKVRNIATGSPFTFLQGGHFGPSGAFAVGDQNSNGLYEIDPQGAVFTIFKGAPLGDIEGVDYHRIGAYVLSDDGSPGTVRNAVFLVFPKPVALTTLVSGGSFGDLNGCAVVPEVHVARLTANPSPGKRGVLAVTSSGAARDQYAFASALSANTGIPLPGGLRFPLDPDGLFFATASNLLPTIFQNYRGVLNIAGQTHLTIDVPNNPALVGLTLYTAGLTLNRNTPTGIHLVSNVERIQIVK